MPNTQTSVPLYAQGEVLTAANLNLTNSGIPVFATTVTRDAAFGGANEKVLAEGQFAYIEATNTTQYYDGAAWQSVGASGLTLVNATSFSSATSVSVNNCFTSSYVNYVIFFNTSGLTPAAAITMRLRASGADNSSANYNWSGLFITYAAGTVTGQFGSLASSFTVGYSNTIGASASITLRDPQTTALTSFSSNSFNSGNDSNLYGGNMTVTTAYDGFTLFFPTGGSTGTVKVYGYANS